MVGDERVIVLTCWTVYKMIMFGAVGSKYSTLGGPIYAHKVILVNVLWDMRINRM